MGSKVESCCGVVSRYGGAVARPRDPETPRPRNRETPQPRGYNHLAMPKKVSASRAALPRRRNDLGEAFASVSPEAAAYVARNPALRAKLLRAAERLGEAFPGHPLHLVLAFDHESGDRDLFIDIERTPTSKANANDLMAFDRQWIQDCEDPEMHVNFNFHH
jgi:hypothetical protein